MRSHAAPVVAAAPAALSTAALGLAGGGFFPGATALATLALCVALLVRVLTAEHPVGGLSGAGLAAAALLAAYTGLVLVSSAWSGAPGRALLEFDRALLYLLVFTLAVITPWPVGSLRVLLRLLCAGLAVVAVAGLAARLLPDVVSWDKPSERLSAPVGYWNAMGLLAAIGSVLALVLSADHEEPRISRVATAALFPVFVTTAYLTVSRGAMAVGLLGLLVAAAAGRPRALVPALVAALPPAVVCVLVAADGGRLVGSRTLEGGDLAQAHRVALLIVVAVVAAALLRLALIQLDTWLASRPRRPPWTWARRLAVGAAVIGVAAVAAVATGLPAEARELYDRSTRPDVVKPEAGRLTDPGLNGRPAIWRVARDAFTENPLNGAGAGTFELRWVAERPDTRHILDAHSLYLETLAELGLAGLALLLAPLAIGVIALWRRRRAERVPASLALALVLAWLVHAGIDWDWEIPAVTLWVFAVLGAACARLKPLQWAAPRSVRVLAALGVLLIALTPARMALWHQRASAAVQAFTRGDCPATIDASLSALDALGARPEPFELLGFCDVRMGRPELGVRMLEAAVDRDPDSWELHYGLAIVRGAAGLDPRPEARAAVRLNPREPIARHAVDVFATRNARAWRRAALRSPLVIRIERPVAAP